MLVGLSYRDVPNNHYKKGIHLMAKLSSAVMGLLAAAALASSGMAFAADPAMTKDGVLTDHGGMTLYTFDKDTSAGKSVCNDQCATNWPPLAASADDKAMGDWSIIKRDDGKSQWVYKGKPLYTFKNDKSAGDKSGDGKGDVWHVAKP
jgi:predicted lipoprotein with Yx(FWY)xxD motif